MWGKGLIAGLKLTWGHFFGKKETVYYPEEKLPMGERFRGGHLVLNVDKCISCKMCSMSCPNAALDLDVKVETIVKIVDDKEKKTQKRTMEAYRHDIGRCMYCNLCVEACAVKALSWDKNYEGSTYFKEDLIYDAVAEARDRGNKDE